ncbi:MAG: exosome complex component [Candidatus Diapherotrites archaeon]|nr:exosome complex component [Candidatus Diapherotrites archaeon]MDN5367064.1 exosome complex component [Candidatus Diapherotrites archaeon]
MKMPNDIRPDGRKFDELRSIEIEAGVLDQADGSARVKWGLHTKIISVDPRKEAKIRNLAEEYYITLRGKEGKKLLVEVPEKILPHIEDDLGSYNVVADGFKGNVAVVAVHGPREPIPRHVGDPYRSVVRFRYTMAPFSVPERKRPAPGRREVEISKVCKEALQRIVFAEEFPMTVIDVFAEILAADAGTRVTALTAASVALADAGIPMRDLVSAVAAGRAFGHIVADLTKFEEDAPDAVDVPMAVVPGTEEFVLLQMDGRVTKREMDDIIELGLAKAKEVAELQRKALKEKYARVVENE